MRNFLQKSAIVASSAILSTDVALKMFGFINAKIFNGRLTTVTLFYFANAEYLEKLTFHWYANRRKWVPSFGGLFFQGGRVGAICVIGFTEADFQAPENRERLLQVHRRMERMKKLLGADTASYSGVLPSFLARAGIARRPIEAERTVHWVVRAIELLRQRCDMSIDTPIVVIGSAGHVGARVVTLLREIQPSTVFELDPRHSDTRWHGSSVLDQFRGQRVVILNISLNMVIDQYAELLWPGAVILNEVYPECGAETLATLKKIGVRYFHIQGIRAAAIPPFPGAYAGAVPCCAASAAIGSSHQEHLDTNDVLLKEL